MADGSYFRGSAIVSVIDMGQGPLSGQWLIYARLPCDHDIKAGRRGTSWTEEGGDGRPRIRTRGA